MSDQPGSAPPPPQHRRRSSFVEMFNPRSNNSTTMTSSSSTSSSSPSAAVSSTPGVPQHRRGMSITTLGLNGSGSSQSSPYNAFARQRRASIATSSGSGSPEFRNSFGDEPAVLEEDDHVAAPLNTPASPSFARRVSFGAQALRDVRHTNGSGASSGGEGFNWSEALRDRTKRSPSFSSGTLFNGNATRPQATSVTVPEPPREMPMAKPVEPPAQRMKKPDHLGERMLRGDFMMD